MTYATELSAIETYFGTQWGSTTPIGYDGHIFTPVNNSVQLTIKPGAVFDGSIGRVLNREDHIGILTISIFTAGGKGSMIRRGYIETITRLFHEKTLTSAGIVSVSPATAFVRFSPPELGGNRYPYIAADFDAMPFHQTNVLAPFVRYEFT